MSERARPRPLGGFFWVWWVSDTTRPAPSRWRAVLARFWGILAKGGTASCWQGKQKRRRP
jgi:hypothetical protein